MGIRLVRTPSRTAWLAFALVSLLGAKAFAAGVELPGPSKLSLSSGVFYSSGDYGHPKDTEIWYTPFAVQYDWHPFALRLTVPYLRIRGPGTPLGLPGGGVAAGGSADSRTRDGIGDVVTSASYLFFRADSALPAVRFTGSIKFGTADRSDGLGTGEEDYTLQTDVSKRFGRFTPFGTLGYRFVGEPSGATLNDTLFTAIGLDARIADRFRAGTLYRWREASTPTSTDLHSLIPYGSWELRENVSIDPYVLFGLSESSGDFGGGLTLRFTTHRLGFSEDA